MQPAREEVMWNLTVPASAASASAWRGAMMSLPSWRTLAARVAEVVDVARLAEHGEDERRHLCRGRRGRRPCAEQEHEQSEESSSGCRPGEGHGFRFELEAREPSRAIGDNGAQKG